MAASSPPFDDCRQVRTPCRRPACAGERDRVAYQALPKSGVRLRALSTLAEAARASHLRSEGIFIYGCGPTEDLAWQPTSTRRRGPPAQQGALFTEINLVWLGRQGGNCERLSGCVPDLASIIRA